MKRVVIPVLLLSVFGVVALAGCGFFRGQAPDTGEERSEEEFQIQVEDVDQALERALAQGGRYIIIVDEREQLELSLPDAPSGRVIWDRRELRVSLPGEMTADAYLAVIQEELAEVGAGIVEMEEGGTAAAQVLTLEVGKNLVVAGRQVPLVTHELTLIQGKLDSTEKGKLALIIDDFGGGVPGTTEMMDLEIPLSFAVLPYRSASREEAQKARERGYEVLLHMPMEPLNEKLSPGPGAVIADMSPDQIREALAAALEEVPEAIGVNNHMGSRVTAREEIMFPFLEAVGERGLFFIDSRTTNKSVGAALARQLGIPAAENRLFLDNEKETESIKKQLRRAADLAREQGEVIAIGHVHPAMVQALQEFVPELEGQEVELVFASQLVR